MRNRLLVIGAGYTGLRLVGRALDAGWDVTATSRSEPRRAELASQGAHALAWSGSDTVAALPIDEATDVVYSVPPDPSLGPDDLVDIARGCRRFVYLSSTSVYGDHAGQRIDEDSPRRPTSPAGKARLEIEEALLNSALDAHVVRIVGIYGPGRTLDRYIAGGRYKLVDGGEKLTNRIHVDDLVTTILAVLERAPRGPRAWLAADGHPGTVRELVQWLVEHRQIAWPAQTTLEQYRAERGDDAAERWANSYSADNRRIREELGVTLAYPTVFDGYRAIFG